MHRPTSRSLLALLPFLAACAGGPGAAGGGPATLDFQVPSQAQMSYTQSDTAVVSVDAGGQMIDVNMVSNALLDMSFAPAERGVRVTATWRELEASVSNPMGAPERFGVDDVEGPLVFDLDRRGAAQVVTTPTLDGNAAQMVSPHAVAHSFFPRLPGGAPTPGMSWTDTIAYEAEEEAGSTMTRSIVTYTVAGDSTVAGRTFLKVNLSGESSQMVEGVMSGMGFIQDAAGGLRGWFLWDLAAGAMHSQVVETDMQGTMDVDAAPFPLEISMRGVSRTTRAGN